VEKLKNIKNQIEEKIKNKNDSITKINLANEHITKKIIELNKKIQELNNKIKQSNVSKNIIDIINDFESKLNNKNKELTLKKQDYEIYKELNEIFSEDGVKLYIKKNILSVLNREIEIILKTFEMNYYSLIIDEYFDSRIYFNNIEITPETLSAGERKRLEFILIISLLKFIQINLLNINVLFLDEIFASVDNHGIEDIIKILKYIKNKLKLNIFLIHHSVVFESEFDNVFLVKKENNFSKIETLRI
jgi:DNA repair exonuclease SbcCD ATPase subunit